MKYFSLAVLSFTLIQQCLHLHFVGIEPTQESFDPAGFTLVSDEELSQSDSQSSDSLEHAQ
jgi:hypothetical protein